MASLDEHGLTGRTWPHWTVMHGLVGLVMHGLVGLVMHGLVDMAMHGLVDMAMHGLYLGYLDV